MLGQHTNITSKASSLAEYHMLLHPKWNHLIVSRLFTYQWLPTLLSKVYCDFLWCTPKSTDEETEDFTLNLSFDFEWPKAVHKQWGWHSSCQPLKQGSPNSNISSIDWCPISNPMALPLLLIYMYIYEIYNTKGTISKQNQSRLVPHPAYPPTLCFTTPDSVRSDPQITSKLEPRSGRKGHTWLACVIINCIPNILSSSATSCVKSWPNHYTITHNNNTGDVDVPSSILIQNQCHTIIIII